MRKVGEIEEWRNELLGNNGRVSADKWCKEPFRQVISKHFTYANL